MLNQIEVVIFQVLRNEINDFFSNQFSDFRVCEGLFEIVGQSVFTGEELMVDEGDQARIWLFKVLRKFIRDYVLIVD